MSHHSSTYRVQFNIHFPFSALEKQVDYLSLLGADAVYASPVFQSGPGSMHGYDVTDPSVIDPELGGKNGFNALIKKLRKRKIHWIQDIVPNHMAFNRYNRWLWDVLEKGKDSEFSEIFDIDWDHPGFGGKLMVPFLGKSLKQVISTGELKLDFENGTFHFQYFDDSYPVNFPGLKRIINAWMDQSSPDSYDLSDILIKIQEFLEVSEKNISQDKLKDYLNHQYRELTVFRKWVGGILSRINSSPSLINSILDIQYYRLAFWKQTEKKINYRRFFTVNGLICLRMEDPQVFKHYHGLLHDLVKQKVLDGLRIDHIDGLQDPDGYLHRLREIVGPEFYIVVEKILEKDEELPAGWKVQGTTGYDFLACVNNLLTNATHYPELAGFYKDITGINQEIEDIIYEKKKFVLMTRMSGELDNLTRVFWTSGLIPDSYLQLTTPERIKKAIAEFLILFPVYRLYCSSFPPGGKNLSMLNHVIQQAVTKNPGLKEEFNILMNLFAGHFSTGDRENKNALGFLNRCMQYTGPLMAKGVEDTTMYYYNQFIGHNEVGDHPEAQGLTVSDFHILMQNRQRRWPDSMNSTSTHDTKRGEDVRARLNVLSDLAPEWISNVKTWMKLNAGYKSRIKRIMVPTVNEEYLIYQTLTGIWSVNQENNDEFKDRLRNYFIKAMREAKTHSAWNEPEEAHEKAVVEFLFRILSPGSLFLQSFKEFQERITGYGHVNSLVQLVLKMTCPGIPDIYQGTELWDLTLVDPDNRQPVDYEIRKDYLQNLVMRGKEDPGKLWQELLNHPLTGEVKLWLTHLLLGERKLNPELFLDGEYMPLEITGKFRENAIAFARKWMEKRFIVILPIHLADIREGRAPGVEQINWGDTSVHLGGGLSGNYLDILSRTELSVGSILQIRGFNRSDPFLLLRSI